MPFGYPAREMSHPKGITPQGGLLCKVLRVLDCVFDRADHVEGLLRKVVVVAVDDAGKAMDRLGQ